MVKRKKDAAREKRIIMEIVVDANDDEERAMGWYYYLDDTLSFPFTATYIEKRSTSPLRLKDEVDVISMAPEVECLREMFVMIPWEKDGLAVPLSQLKLIRQTCETTRQAVGDWHYWEEMGYEF
jgi:hypothetical protein